MVFADPCHLIVPECMACVCSSKVSSQVCRTVSDRPPTDSVRNMDRQDSVADSVWVGISAARSLLVRVNYASISRYKDVRMDAANANGEMSVHGVQCGVETAYSFLRFVYAMLEEACPTFHQSKCRSRQGWWRLRVR